MQNDIDDIFTLQGMRKLSKSLRLASNNPIHSLDTVIDWICIIVLIFLGTYTLCLLC